MFKNLTKKQIIIIVAVAVIIISIIIFLVVKKKKKKAAEKKAELNGESEVERSEPQKKFQVIPEQDKQENEIKEAETEVVEKKQPPVQKQQAPVKKTAPFKPLMEEDMEAFNNLKEGEGLGLQQ
jgi:type IV secretory pathway VirB10-like protein